MAVYDRQMRPYPLGVFQEAGGIRVSFASKKEHCGVILYDRTSGRRLRKAAFSEKERMGDIRYMFIPDVDAGKVWYQFYEEEQAVVDERARVFAGQASYGKRREEKELKAGVLTEDFDWGEDECPQIPYEDCIVYCLHVRGFTKHSSSGVEHRGTFLGLKEKIAYLKELGVTTVELQPAYEFLEVQAKEEKGIPSSFVKDLAEERRMAPNLTGERGGEEEAAQQSRKQEKQKINYWGYTKGYYYAPKAGYACQDPVREFKEMVKAFHENGMEVVMQFYFPREVPLQEIPDILRFWVLTYHVDGFHLMGEQLPATLLAMDAGLTHTKLWYYNFASDRIYDRDEIPSYRNLAEYRDDYMYDMRRFLKGDEGMVEGALYHMRHNPPKTGQINYFTNYYGFTMMDLMSYDYKHNEANGENNQDGSDYNQSWNCGIEGPSRKKQILSLRKKQYKNAMSLLFLSQATPLIFMGDEFGNSQKGNNNPYCQDNEIAWLDWRELSRQGELYRFTRDLIALRKAHPILHRATELKVMDTLSCGYPDLSYHGEAAWRCPTERYERKAGLLYCGKYAETAEGGEDDFFYVAVNMHWEAQNFAMPRLPKGLFWELVFLTEEQPLSVMREPVKNAREDVPVVETLHREAYQEEKWHARRLPPRTIAVYISKERSRLEYE